VWEPGERAFPASLTVIEADAFYNDHGLPQITFAAGSQLPCIRDRAFYHRYLEPSVLPASILEIDPYAFSLNMWTCVAFEGEPLLLKEYDLICSVARRAIFLFIGFEEEFVIGSDIEAIGPSAFECRPLTSVRFESGTRVREFGSRAFAECSEWTTFRVPESVEVIGDQCFAGCHGMQRIEFEGSSMLKRIGERTFIGCSLHSIIIPALTEEIEGSAFLYCPLVSVKVAPGNLLVTSDGTELVTYFGVDRDILVDFEIGSELQQIGRAALRKYESLLRIEIPASVEGIGEASFERCTELESCSFARYSSVITIGVKVFAKCTFLRSFDIPTQVREISSNCFSDCLYLC
jgi:hypothetical protein